MEVSAKIREFRLLFSRFEAECLKIGLCRRKVRLSAVLCFLVVCCLKKEDTLLFFLSVRRSTLCFLFGALLLLPGCMEGFSALEHPCRIPPVFEILFLLCHEGEGELLCTGFFPAGFALACGSFSDRREPPQGGNRRLIEISGLQKERSCIVQALPEFFILRDVCKICGAAVALQEDVRQGFLHDAHLVNTGTFLQLCLDGGKEPAAAEKLLGFNSLEKACETAFGRIDSRHHGLPVGAVYAVGPEDPEVFCVGLPGIHVVEGKAVAPVIPERGEQVPAFLKALHAGLPIAVFIGNRHLDAGGAVPGLILADKAVYVE